MAKKTKMLETTVFLELPCDLDLECIRKYSEKHKELSGKLGKATLSFEKEKTDFKRLSEKLSGEMGLIVKSILDGKEDREIKCIEYTEGGKTVKVIRTDTNTEVPKIQGRPILPLGDKKTPGGKKDPDKIITNDKPGREFKKFTGDDKKGIAQFDTLKFPKISRGDAFRVIEPDGKEYKDPAGNNYFRATDIAVKGNKGIWSVFVSGAKMAFKDKVKK